MAAGGKATGSSDAHAPNVNAKTAPAAAILEMYAILDMLGRPILDAWFAYLNVLDILLAYVPKGNCRFQALKLVAMPAATSAIYQYLYGRSRNCNTGPAADVKCTLPRFALSIWIEASTS